MNPNDEIRDRILTRFSGYERRDVVAVARTYIGVRYSHQGRSRVAGLDCGGVLLLLGRETGLCALEELGYATYPKDGRFEELLESTCDPIAFRSVYPHDFDGTELKPADLLAYDHGSGVQHVAMVTQFKNRRYWVIDALSPYGVTEHPVAQPFTRKGTTLTAYAIRGLIHESIAS